MNTFLISLKGKPAHIYAETGCDATAAISPNSSSRLIWTTSSIKYLFPCHFYKKNNNKIIKI
jgi:hypothetical protein